MTYLIFNVNVNIHIEEYIKVNMIVFNKKYKSLQNEYHIVIDIAKYLDGINKQ